MPIQESDKLLEFVTNLAGDRFLKVEKEIGSGYFVLNVCEAERRQAKHDHHASHRTRDPVYLSRFHGRFLSLVRSLILLS